MSLLFEAVEPITQIIQQFTRYDEDVVDRLNHKYSLIIFTILAIVATTNQYVGEIIKCWSPAQFPDSWVEYANNVCWISNTYYIPMSELNILESPRKEIVYYQWVPLVLFVQAIMFYTPSVHWLTLNRTVGVDMNKMVKLCRDIDHLNPECRDKTSEFLMRHIDRFLQYSREIKTGPCGRFKSYLANLGCLCGKRYGNFLSAIYLLSKLLYIGNVFLQLYLMNHFLGTNYLFFGIEVLRDVASTGTYTESVRFPRVTLCDFEVRALGRNIPYTVQCTLPINLFNEKIFIFVWFWLVFLGIATAFSTVSWLWILFTTNRRSYFRKYLKVFGKYDKKKHKGALAVFSDKYLRQDGHFALRMIGKNTSDVVVGEIIDVLWEYFLENHYSMKEDV